MKITSSILFFFIFISNAIAFEINNTFVKLDLILSFFLFLLIFDKFYIKYFFLLPFFFFMVGLFTSVRYGENAIGVTLNFFLILFFLLFFLNIKYRFSFESLFKTYILAARFCIFFGLIQVVSFFLYLQFQLNLFTRIYDPTWILDTAPVTYAGIFPKISSFFTEPSYLSCFLLPYLIVSLKNFKSSAYGPLNLFCAALVFVFTFSSIGFVSLLLYFITRFSNFKQFFKLRNYFFILLIIVFVISNESIFLRFFQFSESNLELINLSSMVYILNFNLIMSSLNWHYLFGFGLDSYQIVIGNMFETSSIAENISKIYEKPDLMINGAPTLFFRFFVEFGVLGYLIILRNFKFDYLKSPFFFGFLAYCLRSGEYLRFDSLFFLFMFLSFHSKIHLIINNQTLNLNGTTIKNY
jgi:hypothetical protein